MYERRVLTCVGTRLSALDPIKKNQTKPLLFTVSELIANFLA
jgi:hypothetical protein